MRKLIAAATALGLAAVAPVAAAQDEHRTEHQGQAGGHGPPAGGAPHAPAHAPGPPGGGPHGAPAMERGPAHGAIGPVEPPRGGGHEAQMGRGAVVEREPPRGGGHEVQMGHGAVVERPGETVRAPRSEVRRAPAVGPAPRVAQRTAEVARLRGAVRSPRRFRAGAYVPPAGFAVRRWGYGERLPHAFFDRRFWISDFVIFGLFPPPPGLVWVRVGPDALLIDEFTGEIIRVEYDVFW